MLDFLLSKNHLKYIIILIFSFVFIYYFSGVLLPFAFAFIICYIVNPIVNLISRLVKNKYVAIILFYTIVSFLFMAFYKYALPPLTQEIDNFVNLLHRLIQNDPSINQLFDYLADVFANTDYSKYFTVENTLTTAKKIFPFIFESIFNITGGLTSIIIFIFSFILYFIYFTIDMDKIIKSWKNYLPSNYKDKITKLVTDIDNVMSIYFRKQFLIVVILFVLFSIGFFIIQIPIWFILALLVAVLNFIPYMQILAIIPVSISIFVLSYDTGIGFWVYFLQVILVFAIIQFIQDGLLVPKIMGKVSGLHPSILLLSISVFGFLFGLLGLIIAIPVSTLLFSYYKTFVLNKPPK